MWHCLRNLKLLRYVLLNRSTDLRVLCKYTGIDNNEFITVKLSTAIRMPKTLKLRP